MALSSVALIVMVEAYIDCMLWSTSGENDSGEYESLQDFELSEETKEKVKEICLEFYDSYQDDCEEYAIKLGHEQLGHDLWLTSQGHGVGFWDRGLGELGGRLTTASENYRYDAYIGDDDLVYLI